MINVAFKPFTSKGLVSLIGQTEQVPVTILRDSGANQSLICAHVLPFSSQSYIGLDIVVWAFELSAVSAPLHFVQMYPSPEVVLKPTLNSRAVEPNSSTLFPVCRHSGTGKET